MPLLVAVITVIGTITIGVFNIYQNQKAIDVELKYIKEKLQKIEESVLKTDQGIDRLVEFLGDEKEMTEIIPDYPLFTWTEAQIGYTGYLAVEAK